MTKNDFLVTPFHMNVFLSYQGETYWAASCDFEECLYGLLPEKDMNADPLEIRWVRCENVELIKCEVVKIGEQND